jgi:hypothetical protein
LAPFSVAMIVFIIIFGTYTNLYMFKVMNLRILLATAANVWCGMAIGYAISFLLRKPLEDVIAIAIETGVQNTGVSIVVLGLSLQQPDADLASAVPVAASIMTPIPLTLAYIYIKIRNYYRKDRHLTLSTESSCEKEQFKVVNENGSNSCDSNVTIVDVHTDSEFDAGSSTRTSDSNLISTKS